MGFECSDGAVLAHQACVLVLRVTAQESYQVSILPSNVGVWCWQA